MPNQPKTPAHTIRIPTDDWTALRTAATSQGRTVSDLVREAVHEYLTRKATR